MRLIPSTIRTLTRWRLAGICAFLVMATAYGLNYWSLALVFEAARFGSFLAWLAPLTVDGLGFTAMVVFDSTEPRSKLRRYSAFLIFVALSVSAAGGAAHAALGDGVQVTLDSWQRAMGGAIPGVCAAATIHLIGLMRTPGAIRAPKPKPQPANQTRNQTSDELSGEKRPPRPAPPLELGEGVKLSPAQQDAVVRSMMEAGEKVTMDTVAERCRVSKATAKRALRRVRGVDASDEEAEEDAA